MSISSTGKLISARVKRQSLADGFTLIEMIVVLTVLGLAASVVIPSLGSGLPRLRLVGAARDFATLLKFARSHSLAAALPLHVVLDTSRNLYWLDNAEAPAMADVSLLGERKIRLYALPQGVSFGNIGGGILPVDDKRFRILYFPSGGSSGGQVELRDEKGRAYGINVDSVTGRSEIIRNRG